MTEKQIIKLLNDFFDYVYGRTYFDEVGVLDNVIGFTDEQLADDFAYYLEAREDINFNRRKDMIKNRSAGLHLFRIN